MARTSQLSTTAPAPDAVFDALGHQYRRALLARLFEREEPVEVERLAAELAVHEDPRQPDDATAAEIEQVRTRLYHRDLPKLRDHGIVASAGVDDGLVLEDRASYLEPHLELVGERTADW